jgi:hypothetical protein
MKITLQRVRCHKKTENDDDEIYCLVGNGDEKKQPKRFDVGKFGTGSDLLPEMLIWDRRESGEVSVTLMEDDSKEAGRGGDDFIGEILVSGDGSCKPGRCALDEGFEASNRYRRFSMTGSGAHYVVQLEVKS